MRFHVALFLTLLFAGPAATQTVVPNAIATPRYEPPTAKDRFRWFAVKTAGPASLAGGVVSAAWGTLFDSPPEYGPHWEGFGKRYGMRLTGVGTSNVIEASLGVLWGEDPRYARAAGEPFAARVGHVVKSTFVANDREGRERPAYARYAAISGGNFLSNTWRADSEANARDAAVRTLLGFLGRMSSNAFEEFWPDVKSKLFKKATP